MKGRAGCFEATRSTWPVIATTKAVEFFVYDKIKDHMISTGDHRARRSSTHARRLDREHARHRVDAPAGHARACLAPACSWAIVGSNSSRTKGTALFGRTGANMVRVVPYGAINFYVYDAQEHVPPTVW